MPSMTAAERKAKVAKNQSVPQFFESAPIQSHSSSSEDSQVAMDLMHFPMRQRPLTVQVRKSCLVLIATLSRLKHLRTTPMEFFLWATRMVISRARRVQVCFRRHLARRNLVFQRVLNRYRKAREQRLAGYTNKMASLKGKISRSAMFGLPTQETQQQYVRYRNLARSATAGEDGAAQAAVTVLWQSARRAWRRSYVKMQNAKREPSRPLDIFSFDGPQGEQIKSALKFDPHPDEVETVVQRLLRWSMADLSEDAEDEAPGVLGDADVRCSTVVSGECTPPTSPSALGPATPPAAATPQAGLAQLAAGSPRSGGGGASPRSLGDAASPRAGTGSSLRKALSPCSGSSASFRSRRSREPAPLSAMQSPTAPVRVRTDWTLRTEEYLPNIRGVQRTLVREKPTQPLGLDLDSGLTIRRVTPGTPAERCGFGRFVGWSVAQVSGFMPVRPEDVSTLEGERLDVLVLPPPVSALAVAVRDNVDRQLASTPEARFTSALSRGPGSSSDMGFFGPAQRSATGASEPPPDKITVSGLYHSAEKQYAAPPPVLCVSPPATLTASAVFGGTVTMNGTVSDVPTPLKRVLVRTPGQADVRPGRELPDMQTPAHPAGSASRLLLPSAGAPTPPAAIVRRASPAPVDGLQGAGGDEGRGAFSAGQREGGLPEAQQGPAQGRAHPVIAVPGAGPADALPEAQPPQEHPSQQSGYLLPSLPAASAGGSVQQLARDLLPSPRMVFGGKALSMSRPVTMDLGPNELLTPEQALRDQWSGGKQTAKVRRRSAARPGLDSLPPRPPRVRMQLSPQSRRPPVRATVPRLPSPPPAPGGGGTPADPTRVADVLQLRAALRNFRKERFREARRRPYGSAGAAKARRRKHPRPPRDPWPEPVELLLVQPRPPQAWGADGAQLPARRAVQGHDAWRRCHTAPSA